MSEHRPRPDAELDLRAIAGFGVAILLLIVVAGAAMWGMSALLRSRLAQADPPPPVLEEARRPYEPAGPRLQDDPEGELEAMRAEEEAVLTAWGPADEAAGTTRIPIDRAIELYAAGAVARDEVAE